MESALSIWRVWRTGLLFALLGMVPTFLRVHIETLRILPATLRSLEASGLPIPDTLAWSPSLVRWISWAGSWGLQVRTVLLMVVFLLLAAVAVRVALSDSFLRPAEGRETWGLWAMLAVWLGALYLLRQWYVAQPDQVMQHLFPISAAVCAASALLWSADGVASSMLWARQWRAWALVRLVGGGIGLGLLGALVLRFTGFDFGAALYRLMFDPPAPFPVPGIGALADLNPRGWLTFLAVSLAIAAAGSFCWGSLWTAVTAPARDYQQRVRALAAALVPLAIVVSVGVWSFYSVVLGRMDYQRPLDQMAERERIPFGAAGNDTVLLPAADGGVRVARIPFQTIVGFPNEPGVTYKVEQYLLTRRYQTVLARTLLVHLHDVRSIDWDPVRSLEVDRLCIERAPRLQFVQLMVETLSRCAVTPEAKRYLDWLNARCRPFPQSQRACQTMGDLYARFGEERKAQEWYDRGEIPPSSRQKVASTGRIQGRVLWNGQPAEGVRVGVMSRQDALPFLRGRPGAEQEVLVVRPFAWRVVAGVVATDKAGRFEFPALPHGDYLLLLRVESQRLPPTPGAVQVEGFPATVKIDAPVVDIGTIQIRQTGVRPQRPGRAI